MAQAFRCFWDYDVNWCDVCLKTKKLDLNWQIYQDHLIMLNPTKINVFSCHYLAFFKNIVFTNEHMRHLLGNQRRRIIGPGSSYPSTRNATAQRYISVQIGSIMIPSYSGRQLCLNPVLRRDSSLVVRRIAYL